jgi:hypothetical protein
MEILKILLNNVQLHSLNEYLCKYNIYIKKHILPAMNQTHIFDFQNNAILLH